MFNAKTERHYQVVFYLVFKLMEEFTQAKCAVRADVPMPWCKRTITYMFFEFKLNGTAEDALK